ncbi:MAG TPA: hypothetical protein VMT22_21935 [Terriglobales bacterium]|nr:hypothetical protein [Terriglobales bacterium]
MIVILYDVFKHDESAIDILSYPLGQTARVYAIPSQGVVVPFGICNLKHGLASAAEGDRNAISFTIGNCRE